MHAGLEYINILQTTFVICALSVAPAIDFPFHSSVKTVLAGSYQEFYF